MVAHLLFWSDFMDYIFSNKKKNIVAICFSVFYIVMLILKIDFRVSLFQNLRYAVNSLFVYLIPMITPIFILIFIFTYKKDYKFKTWLLPIAFGVNLILFVLIQISNIPNMQVLNYLYGLKQLPTYLCLFLMCVAIALMFLGTLSNLKHINLLKYGALGYAILCLCSTIIDFINMGGFAYIQLVLNGYYAVSIAVVALIREVSCVLFYVGIFILTTNKKTTDLV